MKKRQKAKQQPAVVTEKKTPKNFFTPAVWLKVCIVIQFILLAWQFYPAPSTNGDDAKYFILGTAISELKGYKEIHLPKEPVESQYPIIFPAMLGVMQFFSGTFMLPKILMAGMGVLITLMCFYLGREHFRRLLIPFLFLVATASLMAEFSVILMSEVPYLLLTILALYVYQKSLKAPENKLLFCGAILLSVLPTNCRTVGLAFTGAFILSNIIAKKYRYAVLHFILFVLITIVYKSMTSWDNPYVMQLFQRNSYDPEMGYVTFSEMAGRVLANIKKYTFLIVGKSIVPQPDTAAVFWQGTISSACAFCILVGGLRLFFTPLRIVTIYLFFYFGIMFMWQEQWSSERFLVGIIPFLLIAFLYGLDLILRLFPVGNETILKKFVALIRSPEPAEPKKAAVRAVWIAACIIILLNVRYQFNTAAGKMKQSPDWRNFNSCADWVRLNTPRDAVVMSRKAELFYLRAKRKGLTYPFTHDIDKVIDVMKKEKVKYIVFDNFFWTATTARYLYPVIKSYPDQFNVVYAVKNPDFYVLEFKGR